LTKVDHYYPVEQCIEVNLSKIVIKILQDSVLTQTV